jgi:hypothetical protein
MDSSTEKYVYMVAAIVVMAFVGYFLLLLNWRKESKSGMTYKTYNNKIFIASVIFFFLAYSLLITTLKDITNISCHFDNTVFIVFFFLPVVLFIDNHYKKSRSYEAKDVMNWIPRVITICWLIISLGQGIYYTYTDTSCDIYDDQYYYERVM